MSLALLVGLLFWVCIAFFGSRTMYIEGRGKLYILLKSVKSRSPLLLMILALACYAFAITFYSMEIDAIQDKQGVIGIFFMVSVVFGVIGSLLSSALVFIES